MRSVLQQSKESWQVDWLETVRSRDGSQKTKPTLMRAIVSIYQNEPTSQPRTLRRCVTRIFSIFVILNGLNKFNLR
nr:VirB8/TrbF family protein [Legionella sp. PC1000]